MQIGASCARGVNLLGSYLSLSGHFREISLFSPRTTKREREKREREFSSHSSREAKDFRLLGEKTARVQRTMSLFIPSLSLSRKIHRIKLKNAHRQKEKKKNLQ